MIMLNKNIFAWQLSAICGGDPVKTAVTAKAAGFQSVTIHNSTLTYWRTKPRENLIKALKDLDVDVVGSAAVYGKTPVLDGQLAAKLCNDYGLSAFVFDAEGKFEEEPNPATAAVNMLGSFRAIAPDVKIGWCWWAFHRSANGKVLYHPKEILWAAMQPGYGDADFGVPMVYWSWGDDPASAVAYLQESYRQWREITDKPIIPAGRAYIGDGGKAMPEAIKAFDASARALGAPGITWWSMQHAMNKTYLPGVWEALAQTKPFGQVEEPAPEPKPEPKPVPGIFMKARRFVNIREMATVDSKDLGDIQAGETVGPIVGIAGGYTGAWARLADGRYVCVADQHGITYLVDL
jgi:hypothetical protein